MSGKRFETINNLFKKSQGVRVLAASVLILTLGIVFLILEPALIRFRASAFFEYIPTVYVLRQYTDVWPVIVAIHGTFSAVVPTLGFALVTGVVRNVSTFVPASYITKHVIGWDKFSQFTIYGFIASLTLFILFPSFLAFMLSSILIVGVVAYVLHLVHKIVNTIGDPAKVADLETLYIESALKTIFEMQPSNPDLDQRILTLNEQIRSVNNLRPES